MSNFHKSITIVLIILVVLAIWHFSLGRSNVEGSLVQVVSQSAEQKVQVDELGTKATDSKRNKIYSGPAVSLPHRAAILLKSARGGDKEAACELAELLTKCRDAAEVSNSSSQLGEKSGLLTSRGPLSTVDHQTMECDGVPNIPPNDIVAYWRSAAEIGDASSMRFYVTGRPFRLSDTIANLEELAAFKQHAEQLALEAAASGDTAVAISLADAYYPWPEYGTRQSLLGQAIKKKSAARSLAIYERIVIGLPPGSEARAKQLYNRLDILRLRSSGAESAEAKVLFSEWKPLRYVESARYGFATKICGSP
ncbi:hypothetical protein ACCQ14_20320 [Xanthomonas sp. NCPPB 2865]|uniref:hypothetical protein n=1 Tax=unclassified Xanthomonas TaxID=2643310 RepID=UPI001CF8D701|nr:hypothetical protein [Xanthomonas sp. MWU16-30325]